MDDMDEEQMVTTAIVKSTTLYYGDVNSDDIIMIDIETMKLKKTIASNGINPYEIAPALDGELFVLNRSDTTIGILNSTTDTIDDEIPLDFYPRSIAINSNQNDILLTSTNLPEASIISSQSASASYTDSSYTTPLSYGGSTATGHPVWVDEEYFLLLDRTENTIELYHKDNHTPIDKLHISSSVHHVLSRNSLFYGISEGKQGVVSPAVVKFSVTDGKIILIKEQFLSSFEVLPSDFNTTSWGAHHGALHPSEDYIYVGSTEGNVFVLDLEKLSLVDLFKSGKGVGHFTFYNNTLITTNHYDNFKSFYDSTNPTDNKFINNLSFSKEIYSGITMQSHTSHIVDGKLYFMFNTDQDSILYKIDLEKFIILDSIVIEGAYCLMGSFVESDTQM